MTSATYYLLFKHSSVQHGQCGVSSRILCALPTLAQTPTAAHTDEILPTIERFAILHDV